MSMKDWLLVAVVTSALAFIGTRVLADDAVDIDTYPPNVVATLDGNGDFLYGGNNQDATVDNFMSWPGTVGGETYSSWSMLVADASGSMVVDASAASLAGLHYTPAVGDIVSVTGTFSPNLALPVLTPTGVTVASRGNPQMVGSEKTTIGNVLSGTGPGYGGLFNLPIREDLEGYLVEIDDVTISGQGSLTVFPATNSGTGGLNNLYLNDTAGHKLTMYFSYTSYACDGAMVGAPIPTSPVDVWGLLTSDPSVTGTTTNWQDQLIPTAFEGIPEPSSFMLAGIGLLSLIAALRRRHS